MTRSGGRSESRALQAGFFAAFYVGNPDLLREPVERLLHIEPQPDTIALLVEAFFSIVTVFLFRAQPGKARAYLQRLEQIAAPVMDHDSFTASWVELTRSIYACHAERDPWRYLHHARRSVAFYDKSGVGKFFPWGHYVLAFAHSYVGLFDEATKGFSTILSTVLAGGTEWFNVEVTRSLVLLDQRKLDEAFVLATWAVRESEKRGGLLQRLPNQLAIVEVHLYRGDIDAAEAEALALSEGMMTEPYFSMWYWALIARIRLVQGRATEASEIAERAFAHTQASGMGFYRRHPMLLLVRAEALHVRGDHAAACDAIRQARDDLLRRADLIPHAEPGIRRSFLENLPDHRRTLLLAREWLGDE